MLAKINIYRFAEWWTGDSWEYIDNNYGDDDIEEINDQYEEYLESSFTNPDEWMKSVTY